MYNCMGREKMGAVNCDRRGVDRVGELKMRRNEERGPEEANWRGGKLNVRGTEAKGPVGEDRGTYGKGAEGELEVKGPEGSWNGVES